MKLSKLIPQFFVVAATMCNLAASTAHASGAMPVGATEMTQVANNIELVASVAKQSEMVTEQIRAKLIQIEQLATMTRNLERLGGGDIESALAPHRAQLGAYNAMLGSVFGLRDSALRAGSVMAQRKDEFARLGFADPGKYMAYEFGLAKQKGGAYRQRLMQDIDALDAMRRSHEQFQRVSADTATITGNLQGLQKLSQLSSMATGELMQLRAAVVAQNADAAAEKQAQQSNVGHRAAAYEITRRKAEEAANRAAPRGLGVDPLKSWEHLTR